mgnify:CR=1 FL=1|tara:strand:+ start:422 stop:778 length:357 start_codon:yes stop_codon:yes gene_type:complete
MTLGTKIYTLLNGELIGIDSMGNRYYRKRRLPNERREKRWVVFKDKVEASLVPPAWHSWLHYTTDQLPEDDIRQLWDWQKSHLPNMTGTKEAYRPSGHILKGGSRPAATGDYEPWEPS